MVLRTFSDGSTSDLSVYSNSPIVVAGQIGGGALSFNGANGNLLYAATAGNAADDLSAYPVTFSFWTKTASTANGLVIMDVASTSTTFLSSGNPTSTDYIQIQANSGEVRAVRRTLNSNSNNTRAHNSTNGSLTDQGWHQVIAIAEQASVTFYFDGKFDSTTSLSLGFPTTIDSIAFGGYYRTSVTGPTSFFTGSIDDAGLFTSLTAADAALINGLGRTGGLGLDVLGDAQALLAASLDSTAVFGGTTWKHVTGLTGVVGAWGGSVAGQDAYIVTGLGGEGIVQVPEPGACIAIGTAMAGFLACRRRVGMR